MGPGSWAALARACGLALAGTALNPVNGGGRVLIAQVQRAVHARNYELAQAMLAQLKRRDRELYKRFLAEFGEGWAAESEEA